MKNRDRHGIPEASVPLLEFFMNGLRLCGLVQEWTGLVAFLAGYVYWGMEDRMAAWEMSLTNSCHKTL